MQIKVIISIIFFILFLNGCQKNIITTPSTLSISPKFLVINKKSLDNKQNIQQDEILNALKKQLDQYKLFSNEHIKRTIEFTDNKLVINYYNNKNIALASYRCSVNIKTSKNAHTLTFIDFSQHYFQKNKVLNETIEENFKTVYNYLDKLYFSKKKVFIYVNNFASLLTQNELTKKLSKYYKPYKQEEYTNIYWIDFFKRKVPTYFDLRENSHVHIRSYIPYEMNTKSGASLSTYQLELFKHKLENLVSK